MKESIFSSGLKIGRFEESSTTVSYHRILYIMKYANEILHMICKLSGYVYDLTSRISNRLSSYRLYIWTQTVLDSRFHTQNVITYRSWLYSIGATEMGHFSRILESVLFQRISKFCTSDTFKVFCKIKRISNFTHS